MQTANRGKFKTALRQLVQAHGALEATASREVPSSTVGMANNTVGG